jgi:GTP cyclohydrolase I
MSFVREYVKRCFDGSHSADAAEITQTTQRHADFLSEFFHTQEEEMTTFTSDSSCWVFVQSVPVYSMCEHHIIPFFGEAKFVYRPNGKILGLSKFPRLVRMVASSLQTQERLTDALFTRLADILCTDDLSVALSCRHLCMEMRGVRAASNTETIRYSGQAISLGLQNLKAGR